MRFIPQDRLPIENVPKIKSKKCRFFAFSLYFILVITPFLISFYIWYEYNWLIAAGGGLFLYLVSAIASSKLRIYGVPPDQRERNLSSMDIIKWYVHTNLCFHE